MFTLQTPDLVKQIRGHVPDPVVTALESMLGNGAAELVHRGPVTVEIDGNFLPSIGSAPRGGPIPRNCNGTATAAMTVINRAGKFSGASCKTQCVDNGLALRAIGPSQLDEARIDTLYVGSIKDLCGKTITNIGGGGTDPDPDPDPETPTGSADIVRFVVTNGASGNATIVEWSGSAYTPTGDNIKIVDMTPTLEFQTRWRTGYYGWGVRMADRLNTPDLSSAIYEVLWVESRARFVEFTLTSAMTGSTAGGLVVRTWGSDDHANPPTGTIFITDRTGRMQGAPIGTAGIAVYDERTSQYVTLHSYYSTSVVVTPPEEMACIRIINDGLFATSCLFLGEMVEIDLNGSPCSDSIWINPVEVYVFAPNYVGLGMMPPGRIHFGMKLSNNWNGTGKPLYLVKPVPDEIVCLKFEDSTRRDDCVYEAQLVDLMGVENYCGNMDELESVYVYLPNSDADAKKISGVRFAWGKLLLRDYNGKKLYFSKLDVRNHLVLFATVEIKEDFDCSSATGKATPIDWIKQGEHQEPWTDEEGQVLDEIIFDNIFSFCGKRFMRGLVMLNQAPGKKPILIQMEHTCMEVVTAIAANETCFLDITYQPVSVVRCGEPTTTQVNLEDIICECCE